MKGLQGCPYSARLSSSGEHRHISKKQVNVLWNHLDRYSGRAREELRTRPRLGKTDEEAGKRGRVANSE
jgi:hypothetical protein